jgi:homogentisate solanesyltransferase
LPDIEGDMKYDITTFASQYGAKAISTAATIVLGAAYLIAIALPKFLPNAFRPLPMILGHTMSLVYLLFNYRRLHPEDLVSVKKFYKVIWNLFYFEYILYPFI